MMRLGKVRSQKSQIYILRQVNPDWTIRKIAQTINRHQTTISRYLKDPERQKNRPKSGRPKVTTAHEDRLIIRQAKNYKSSSQQIVSELNLGCSSTTVFRRLDSDSNLRYSRHKLCH